MDIMYFVPLKVFRRGARRAGRSRGFGLIEVLVSVGLISIIATSVTAGFISQTRFDSLAQERGRATAAAQLVLDSYRLQDPTTLPSSGSATQSVTVAGKTFTVRTSFCATAALCSSSRIRHLKAVVTNSIGLTLYQVETVYAQLR